VYCKIPNIQPSDSIPGSGESRSRHISLVLVRDRQSPALNNKITRNATPGGGLSIPSEQMNYKRIYAEMY